MTITCGTNNLGSLVLSRDGHTAGPYYGEVYTAPSGQHGYIAGVRNKAALGIGLYQRAWFSTRTAAEDYIAALGAY